MPALKNILLINLLIFIFGGAGFLFVKFYFSAERSDKSAETPVQPPAEKTGFPDSRFDRAERDPNLQAETDALLALFDQMPPVPVYIKDEPLLKTGTNTETGAAYTHCDDNRLPIIFVKKIFYQKASRKQRVNALKHELTHAWLCRRQMMSVGHGSEFRRKFAEVGGFGN